MIRFSIKSPNPSLPILNREAERGMTWAEWVNSYYNLKYRDIYENGESHQYFETLEISLAMTKLGGSCTHKLAMLGQMIL